MTTLYSPILVTAPAIAPLQLDDVKRYLAVEHADHDNMLMRMILSATRHLDGPNGILGRVLVEQTWRQDFSSLSETMRLPFGPVISITSAKYFDAAEVEQTIASGNYAHYVDATGPYVRFLDSFSLPSTREQTPVASITFKAGYPNTGNPPISTVPEDILQALRMIVAHWYRNREAVVIGDSAVPLPLGAEALLGPYRSYYI